MAAFAEASTLERVGPNEWRGRFDDGWLQGRGCYGGLVSAALMRPLEAVVGDARRTLRSVHVHFCAPVLPEVPTRVEASEERTGLMVAHARGRMLQNEKVVALASATLAAPRRDVDLTYDRALPPEVAAPDSLMALPPNPLAPVFLQHFVMQLAGGSLPYAGADEPLMALWLQTASPEPVDAALAVGFLDALAPAALTVTDRPRPAASVDLTAHFLAPLPDPEHPDGPHLVVSRSVHAAEGYAEERAELWSPGNRLLAVCRQLVAILG